MAPSPLVEVRAFLPAWVVLAPAILSLAACAVTLAATRVAAWLALRPLARLPPDAHWTQRARLAWPARREVIAIAIALGVASAFLPDGGPFSLPPPHVRAALLLSLQLAIAVGAGISVERRLFPGPGLRERLSSLAAWGLLLYPHLIVAVLFAAVTAATGASPALGTAVALAAVAWLALGGGFWIGRRVGLVRVAPDRLARALERAREGSGLPAPRLLELPVLAANAFALPVLGAVGVTTGALRAMDDDELAAILRHELAHLAERRSSLLLRAANALILPVAIVAAPPLLRSGSPWLAAVLFWAAALWLVLVRRFQRRQEAHADEAAHAQAGDYARALETLHRVNLLPAVLGRRATHPDLHDRIAAAGVTPEWPKPEPPPRRRGLAIALALAIVTAVGGSATARYWLGPVDPDDRAGLLRAVALAPTAADFADLGRLALERNDLRAATTFYRAAEALDP